MSVSAGARFTHMAVLGGLLALAVFFPFVWFGVTPFNSDEEFSDQDIAALLEGKDIPDVYARPLPDRTLAELAQQKDAFTWCRFCHTLNQGGHNRVGPNLHGIFGQPAAVVDHFPYSAAFVELREGGFAWTQELMERFIEDPAAMVPGNRMRYPPMIGYDKNPGRDAMIIEYLIRMTAPGAPSDDTIPSLTAAETS